jgi:hypothetical protein
MMCHHGFVPYVGTLHLSILSSVLNANHAFHLQSWRMKKEIVALCCTDYEGEAACDAGALSKTDLNFEASKWRKDDAERTMLPSKRLP